MTHEGYRRNCEDAASLGSLDAKAECIRQGWWPGLVIVNADGNVMRYQDKPLVFDAADRERAEMILGLLKRNAPGPFLLRESTFMVPESRP